MSCAWYHEVDPEWLKARRQVITATDLVELRKGWTKLTKAQKEGREIAPTFLALWGRKHLIGEDDPTSYRDAARGHFMEPYAVHDFNQRMHRDWHHWDDCIIVNSDGIGFSPDALDVEQVTKFVRAVPRLDAMAKYMQHPDGPHIELPSSMLEIKAYDIPAHMKAIATKEDQLPERWQVAGAFMVLPKLEEAYVVFYCPKTEIGIGYKHYTRSDLTDEIEELSEIIEVWNKQKRLIDAYADNMMVADFTEEQIERDFAEFWDNGTLRFR